MLVNVAAAKNRLDQTPIGKLLYLIDDAYLSLLQKLNNEAPDIGKVAIVHFDSLYFEQEGKEIAANLYLLMFREGILFSCSPIMVNDADLLKFLSQRNHVTRELIKRRKPQLSHVAVLIADLQDSAEMYSSIQHMRQEGEMINPQFRDIEMITILVAEIRGFIEK